MYTRLIFVFEYVYLGLFLIPGSIEWSSSLMEVYYDYIKLVILKICTEYKVYVL